MAKQAAGTSPSTVATTASDLIAKAVVSIGNRDYTLSRQSRGKGCNVSIVTEVKSNGVAVASMVQSIGQVFQGNDNMYHKTRDSQLTPQIMEKCVLFCEGILEDSSAM